MNMRTLRRIAAMPPRELRFRLVGAGRILRDRVRVAATGSRWDRGAIVHVLSAGALGEEGQRDAAREDWGALAGRLRRRLTARRSRFVLDPAESSGLATATLARWPEARRDAVQRADAILGGRFDLLGYTGLSFAHAGARIDWHFDPVHGRVPPRQFWADVPFLDPRIGDHKVIWELNRQQYLLTLGRAWWLTADRRYRDAIVAHIGDWLAANPPLVGVNWSSMLELGFRALSWVAALHFVLGAPRDGSPPREDEDEWLLDLCIGLDRQLTHVEQNLSFYFSPNTHLTGEALALYVVGTALPELARSHRWAAVGRAALLAEVTRQIHGDGGHCELSSYYHRYTLDFYTLALTTAELAGDKAAADVFRAAVDRLATFMAAMADGRGVIPLIGDDDGGMLWPLTGRDPRDVHDALSLAGVMLGRRDLLDRAIPEETLWLAWSARPAVRQMAAGAPPPLATSVAVQHFAESGYAVVRSDEGDHLIFDVGRHGFLNAGHAHADALACTLSLAGQPLLIDPGTGTYTMDAQVRRRFRESASHNTLTLGGRSLAVPAGPFSWASRASAQLRTGIMNPMFTVLEGTHDGYAPAQHRRTIVHGPGSGWLFLDTVTGHSGEVDAYWHFDPAWHLALDRPGRVRATGAVGTQAWLLHDRGAASLARGETGGLGWCAPRYGRLQPTFTVRVHHQPPAAAAFVTWIGSAEDEPSLEVPLLRADPESPAAVVRVTTRNLTTLVLLGPDAARWHDDRQDAADGSFSTDARLALVTRRRTGRLDVSLVETARFSSATLPLVELRGSAAMPDLHVRVDGRETNIWSSAPPPQLTLRWGAGSRPLAVRLNGREAVLHADSRHVILGAAAWGDARRTDGQRAAISAATPAIAPAGVEG
jgi:hypothetical protein